MVKIGRGRAGHFVFLICALLALGSITFFHATGSAGALEGVTAPVEETVGDPVQRVTETVTPPVHEVTETVTQPVQAGTEAVAPPVHEATETVAAPAKEVTETVTRPAKQAIDPVTAPVKKVTETVTSTAAPVKVPAPSTARVPTAPSGSSPGSGVPVVREATRAIHSAQGTVGPVTQAVPAGRSSTGPDDRGGTSGPRDEVLGVPSSHGSIRAPLPKWMAYIWPAIALRAPALADLLRRWEQDGLRLVLGVFGTATGSGDGQVVAGVHASGGRPAAPDSSSSAFPKVPSVVPLAFPADDGWQGLAGLLIVAATVLAVAVAVRHEVLFGHRRGREP